MAAQDTRRVVFAYGSNLWRAQMAQRCPDSRPLAAVELPNHRLAFVGERTQRWGRGGVATVLPQPGGGVPGALYELSAADEAELDGYEGVASGHYRKDYSLLCWEGIPVLAYVALITGENAPNARYLQALQDGYADWNLDNSALRQLATYPAEEA